MPRSAEQTTSWVAGVISKMPEVSKAEIIGPHTLHIDRRKYDSFVAAIVAVQVVTAEILEPVLDTHSDIEIAVNVPKESMWTGEAIELAAARDVAFGGISDLMSAIANEDVVREYVRREYAFVERGLHQHDRVAGLEREFDRVYVVRRHKLPPVRFVMLNEYELTGDHVRTARSRYGSFDAVLINNPNGKATGNALEIAKSMGVSIFKWGEFLGRLNRR